MIAFDHVSVSYPGTTAPAIHDVSLEIDKGAFFVLIGESGSGKTTTLHLINRLLEPNAGRVLIDGAAARHLEPVALRRGMGFIFQAIGLFPNMTVAENIGVTPKLLHWPPSKIAARVDELLELVRLPPVQFRNRLPSELSGGQRQRVGLARALAARPSIMLMDEPFGALDPVTRDDLAAEYRAIHDALGLTTVLVTHDMTEAFLLADQVAVMRDGQIVQSGTPQELLAAPADDFVRALIETPRRRARRLAEVMLVSGAR
ncbi:MAG TPA: ATP-binding cassette domain-containing protein [Rhizomicrobium sp.]|nr:ATP-binding cassette domain-containing protein [Rhizomicrobium sp.]